MRDLPPAALLSKGLPQLALGQVEIKQPCGWKGGEHISHHPMPLRVDLSKKLQSGAKLGLPEPPHSPTGSGQALEASPLLHRTPAPGLPFLYSLGEIPHK